MSTFRVFAIMVFFGISSGSALGQCSALKADASTSDLTRFLRQTNSLATSERNTQCVEFALDQLNFKRAPEAVDVLIDYLDFERPLTQAEKEGFSFHGGPRNIGGRYPACGALMTIGKPAIPALLSAIKAGKLPMVRRNAAYTIMQIFRTDPVRGIETLKRETAKSEGGTPKSNLDEAAKTAVQWCDETQRGQCEAAANGASK